MVTADNRAYDYDRYESLEDYQISEPNQKPVKKTEKKAKPRTHIFSILFVFGMSIFIISRYAYMAEINFNISTLEKEYKKVVKENTDLNVQLMKTINLEALEKTAIEDLNMQYPDVQSQTVYVSVDIPKAPSENGDNDFYNIKEVQENKYIAYTKAIINNILSVLD